MANQRQAINSYDLDGVISIGITPRPEDVIITGRSFEESEETYKFLQARGIYNAVFFNPLKFKDKTRKSSGEHKATTLQRLVESGVIISKHFEDDIIQKEEIEKHTTIPVILLQHNLTEKENIRHSIGEDVL